MIEPVNSQIVNQHKRKQVKQKSKGEMKMSVAREATSRLVSVQSMDKPWAQVFAVSAAILIGMFIISGVGFAGPEVIHNAAHDVRHVLAFPCH